MSTKTQQLDKLFQKWEEHVPEYKGHFVRDGIINEELFEKTNPKILFITKEPNNPEQSEGDFREWWRKEVRLTFSKRIAEWSFGILNDFPVYDIVNRSTDKRLNAIQKIAFMNVKKTGGKGQSNNEKIREEIRNNFKFIHDEIRIISPDIIITGLSEKETRNTLFPELKDRWVDSGYDIAIARFSEKTTVIDYYHPSSWNAGSASYSLLQNIIKSSAFAMLC